MAGSRSRNSASLSLQFLSAAFALTVMLVSASTRAPASEFAAGEAEARRVVQGLGETILKAVKIQDKDMRRSAMIANAGPAVDFKTISVSVLANAEIQVPPNRLPEVMDGLVAYVARAIIEEIEQIHPETAKLGGSTVKSPTEIRIPMQLAGPMQKIDADWVVKNNGAGWRVTDILVSGYSLTAHYGSKLGRRVGGNIEQLTEMMSAEKKLAPAPLAAVSVAAVPMTAMPVAAVPQPRMEAAAPRTQLVSQMASPAATAPRQPQWAPDQLTDLLRF